MIAALPTALPAIQELAYTQSTGAELKVRGNEECAKVLGLCHYRDLEESLFNQETAMRASQQWIVLC